MAYNAEYLLSRTIAIQPILSTNSTLTFTLSLSNSFTVLPTNGTAKFFSPLNVDDYMKKSSIISYSRDALQKVHKDIELFAEKEGLTAHANSIRVRFENEND